MSEVVIVTRHQALVDLLAEMGIRGKVISHASPEEIRGKVVIGNLPTPLQALTAEVIVPVLDLRPEDRGKELDLETTRARFRGLRRYRVQDLGEYRP